ncbi:insulin-like growth factor-binding protein complex acid labile subunit [Patella vulgata]|uniref:insulin-like growth factor-binding protein complex acid labile subunit n=1 Tax=Patella vulgata TaxID=6465 RepID=UPI0024A80A49|nr:insulin-like growth factor-binding protein complex acid labile subunit [Patella vulgata]XP_050388840.2 insulin-like growth factor-binding protein complex acid labile subunit [Patella vulgata]XP_050388841.2 insulin-like growth factor-binding protein complex acid labile subunit [Patella vulgata]XP_050388842.2 insulin-like growth factor-binding protein complex acid labile subunit [Patella vulgata]XP_050388847.2 insulin-like growth factor-binding protein complex acid labile subunit [Patella vulg
MEDVGICIFLLWIMGFLGVAAVCPDLCQCHQDYFVYCRRVSLTDENLRDVMKEMPPEVRLLDLGSNNLQNITATIFSHLPNLEYLNLSDNQISSIDEYSFRYQTMLRDLNLNRNRLMKLNSATFHGLSRLKELDLGSNNIRSIESGAFSEFTILQQLYLHQNKLDNVSSDMFLGLDNLHLLDLSDNVISVIGDASFRHFKKLWKLKLNNNQLREIKLESFAGLSSVRELDLSYNHFTSVGFLSTLTFRETISAIYLSHNLLKHIPVNLISTIRRLETLDLSHNYISSVSRDAFFGLSLLTLNLSSNAFTKIDRGMFSQTRKIMNLDLSFNHIEVVKTGALDSFRETVYYLNLHHNKLTEVNPGMFRGMKNLLQLDLDYNNIDNIYEGSFRQLVKLEELRISHNKLTTIRDSMLNGPPYQSIHLLDNQIQKFSGFKFEEQNSPIRVHLNLTAVEQNESSVRVQWPYRDGSQIYWKVAITCDDGRRKCVTRPQDEYLAPYRMDAVIEDLSPNSKYYICVYPVFINKNIFVDQCVHVSTRPSRALTTVTVKEPLSKPLGENGCTSLQGVSYSWTMLLIIICVLSWSS